MNREKMRAEVRRLREKKANRPVAPAKKAALVPARSGPDRPIPKPQVKRGVVKVESLSSKRDTPTQTTDNRAERRRHTEIMRSAQKKHGTGCGGCRRK